MFEDALLIRFSSSDNDYKQSKYERDNKFLLANIVCFQNYESVRNEAIYK